jgi:MarR family transcriptional regulator, organic hydroperoxide resistance regulator
VRFVADDDITPDLSALELDRQLCFALYTASRAMTRAYGPLLDETGLTYPQYLAMLVLWENGPERSLTVGELGTRLHLDSGTLTPLLKRLESSGLIRRHRNVTDERQVLVDLTEQGAELRMRSASIPTTMGGCIGLTDIEVGDLRERLVDLTKTLEALPVKRL